MTLLQIAQLRTGKAWEAKGLPVDCHEATPLCGVSGAALDMELIMRRCAHTSCCAVLLAYITFCLVLSYLDYTLSYCHM